MIIIHTLASGSEGNAALVCGGGTRILVDAGISARRIETALKDLGYPPDSLSAVFITHTHTDHTAGLRVFLKHTALPVFASPAACAGPSPEPGPSHRHSLCHLPRRGGVYGFPL